MRIESTSNGLATLQKVQQAADRDVQSVFSQLLIEAGREGYASAAPVESADSEGPQIADAWNSWYQTSLTSRYRQADHKLHLGKEYEEILVKAHQADGYIDPQSFLSGLSAGELETVQHIHWLAEPIKVDSLTEEGALNLLIPPPAQVDLNHDGLTQSGAAYGIRFPDSTTPPSVAAAWEEATAGMELKDRMLYELQMKLPVLLANIVTNADGTFSHQREPGDPDFVNPMASPDYSYVGATQKQIDYLEYFKPQLDPIRYEKEISFWRSFQQSLEKFAAT